MPTFHHASHHRAEKLYVSDMWNSSLHCGFFSNLSLSSIQPTIAASPPA